MGSAYQMLSRSGRVPHVTTVVWCAVSLIDNGSVFMFQPKHVAVKLHNVQELFWPTVAIPAFKLSPLLPRQASAVLRIWILLSNDTGIKWHEARDRDAVELSTCLVTLSVKQACFSAVLITAYQTTRHHNPQDQNLYVQWSVDVSWT